MAEPAESTAPPLKAIWSSTFQRVLEVGVAMDGTGGVLDAWTDTVVESDAPCVSVTRKLAW
jgi:hypothetical protein